MVPKDHHMLSVNWTTYQGQTTGNAVAALSIGTLSERMSGERVEIIATMLATDATHISEELNPFDPVIRYPSKAAL